MTLFLCAQKCLRDHYPLQTSFSCQLHLTQNPCRLEILQFPQRQPTHCDESNPTMCTPLPGITATVLEMVSCRRREGRKVRRYGGRSREKAGILSGERGVTLYTFSVTYLHDIQFPLRLTIREPNFFFQIESQPFLSDLLCSMNRIVKIIDIRTAGSKQIQHYCKLSISTEITYPGMTTDDRDPAGVINIEHLTGQLQIGRLIYNLIYYQ